jgi:hypothetical protein
MPLALGIGYAALIVYIANTVQANSTYALYLRWMLSGLSLLLATIGLGVLFNGSDLALNMLMFVFCLLSAATAAAFIWHSPTQHWLRRVISPNATYDPSSLVHTTALVLMMLQLTLTLVSTYVAGGTSGVAENLSNQPPNTQQLGLDLGVNVLFALGGVGFFMRRNLSETLQRLGIHAPTILDVALSIALGILMYIGITLASLVWQSTVSLETFERQTSAANAMFAAYASTPLLGVALAASSAVGEEVLYRGALQPVFGILITTGYFVLLHTQYLFTPAMLLILALGLVLAFVRARRNTTTAIMTHFVYNLIPFILVSAQGAA